MTAAGLPAAPFFIHVMKTAGGTFREQLKAHYGEHAIFPVGTVDPDMVQAYWDLNLLRAATPERHQQTRCYSGHYPFCATAYVPRPLVTLTLLRDPVDRIVSYLRHCQQHHTEHRGLSFDEIYEDPFYHPCFMRNHQVKVFAMVVEDVPESVMDVVDIDERRLAIAKQQLAEVDVIGRREDYADFLGRATSRLGWTPGEAKNVNVGSGGEASSALRRRIAADNEADLAFYAHAVELTSKQRATV